MFYTPPTRRSNLLPLAYPCVISALVALAAYLAGYWVGVVTGAPMPEYRGYACAAVVGCVVLTVLAIPWNNALIADTFPEQASEPEQGRVMVVTDDGRRGDYLDISPDEARAIVERQFSLTLNAPGIVNSRMYRIRGELVRARYAVEAAGGRVVVTPRGERVIKEVAG